MQDIHLNHLAQKRENENGVKDIIMTLSLDYDFVFPWGLKDQRELCFISQYGLVRGEALGCALAILSTSCSFQKRPLLQMGT